MPLVGVWVKGPDFPLHPLVAAACFKFYYSSTLLDRALQQDGSFLVLLCPEGGLLMVVVHATASRYLCGVHCKCSHKRQQSCTLW